MKRIFICIILTLFTVNLNAQFRKPSVVVANFQIAGEIDTALAKMINVYILNYFIETGKYRVVERLQLAKLLKEMRLSASDLVDSRNVIKIGKLLSAYGILVGSILRYGDDLVISARLVETQTGTITKTAKERFNIYSAEVLEGACRSLVNKIIGLSRFEDNGNGTITDNYPGNYIRLMWQKNITSNTYMTFDSAINYASNLRLGGYTNWRLPNKFEFEELLKGGGVSIGSEAPFKWLNSNGFIGIKPDTYWTCSNDFRLTAEPESTPDYAFVISMHNGAIQKIRIDRKRTSYSFFCVRSL